MNYENCRIKEKTHQERNMKTYRAGFTLVEMAIVLVIVGLLLGGLLMPLSAQVEQRRISETQKALDEIKEALLGFAIANKHLPCPADPTLASGAPGAGQARAFAAGACTGGNSGVLPWATLGVSETDAWGNRYTYHVAAVFADPATFFTLGSTGDSIIRVTSGGTTVASAIPAVIVSHGKNGSGAYNTAGKQVAVSADVDEAENSNNDTNFVSKTPTATFDDIVTWLSPNILFNRMVTAGKLP
ncbi:MAG: prepilin-type N-terminal cleavage/methylation domain-containing protein [Sulfuricella sp.]